MNTRRKFISGLAMMGAISALPFRLSARSMSRLKPLPALKGRKVLFVYGGWDGHEPVAFRDHLGGWLQSEGADVTFSDTLDIYTDAQVMAATDLVIQIYTMSEISAEQEAGLVQAVRNGAGIAGWHGGLCDAFRNHVDYQYMTGGQWVAHPGGVIGYRVHITDQQDEVTHGLKDFAMTSEQYYMHVDPNVKVLATTTFSGANDAWIAGCVMPVTWKKMYGAGRVFYTSLGHNLQHILDSPAALAMLQHGIRWASASKYEAAERWVSPVYK